MTDAKASDKAAEEAAPRVHSSPPRTPVRRPPGPSGSIQAAKKKKKPADRYGADHGAKSTAGVNFHKPPANLKTAQEKHSWLWSHGGAEVVENRLRAALGKRIKITGPTGKQVWHAPSEQERLEAQRWVCDKLIPTPQSVQIGGDPDNPVKLEGRVSREDLADPREAARRGLVLIESLGLKDAVAAALGADPDEPMNGTALPPGGGQERRNGSAPPRTPEPIDVTPEPSEAVERAAEETPSIRGIGSGLEVRQRGLVPPERWSLWLGVEIEVRNHGNISGRANTGELFSVWQGGRELQKPSGWSMAEKLLDKLLAGQELPYSQTVTVSAAQRVAVEAPDQRSWLSRLKR